MDLPRGPGAQAHAHALLHLGAQAQELNKKYVQFEKQHGDRDGIESVVTSKKRFQYEEAVKKDP